MDERFLQKAYTYYQSGLKEKGYSQELSLANFKEIFPYWYEFMVIHGDPNIPYMCDNGRTVILEHSSIIKKVNNS
jgi:hypothetical protein